MTLAELRADCAMQGYARIYVMRALKRADPDWTPEAVDECIKDGFAGDAVRFEEAAWAYVGGGCGIGG
jgi:hypothetical protein